MQIAALESDNIRDIMLLNWMSTNCRICTHTRIHAMMPTEALETIALYKGVTMCMDCITHTMKINDKRCLKCD